MTVIRVLEDAAGRDGSTADSGERTYTRVFTVETSSPQDGPEVIFDSDVSTGPNSIPKLNQTYIPASGIPDFGAWCVNVKAVPTISRQVWRVIASYSNRLPRPDEGLLPPDMRKPRIEWDTITGAFPITYDLNGAPIDNTADDPFDPAITDEDSWMLLRISRNQKRYRPLFYLGYQGKLNADLWNGFLKRQVKCRKIRASEFFEGGEWYWNVVSEFEIRESRFPAHNFHVGEAAEVLADLPETSFAWVKWILNRGYRENYTGLFSTGKRPCVDPFNKLILSNPALLDIDGHQLPTSGDPLYLGFDTIRDIAFEPLDLNVTVDT